MKKISNSLLLIFLGLCSFQSQAFHLAGGDIAHRYIGDSTGIANHYEIILCLYQDVNGNQILGPNATVGYQSACFPIQNINMTRFQNPGDSILQDGGVYFDDLDDCVDPNAPGFVLISKHCYRGTIILQGLCSDHTFWYRTCNRNISSNLVGTDCFYIESVLNNRFGPNTSPQFVNPAAKSFCTNQHFTWSQNAVEPNGDSIRFELAPALDDQNVTVTYQNGYSAVQPITTQGALFFDDSNGTFKFKTGMTPENCVVKVNVVEYRFDSLAQQYVQIANSMRDMQIVIADFCRPEVAKGPKIDLSATTNELDTTCAKTLKDIGFQNFSNTDFTVNGPDTCYILPVIDYGCYDDSVHLVFDSDILCESLSGEGSEFRLIGPDSVARPIIGVNYHCRTDLTFNEVSLKLHRPLDENGDYYLQIKRGFDQTTLINECGFELDPYYTMVIRVNNCPILDYSIDNLTVQNDRDRRIDWSITDPNYLNPKLFNYWQIGMKVGGLTYYRQSNDINARSFIDTIEFIDDHVDHQNFEYWVQLVQNADFKAPTENPLITIRLQDSLVYDQWPNGKVYFNWNPYNAWDLSETEYQMYSAEFDPNTPGNMLSTWEEYGNRSANYFNNSYELDRTDPNKEGLFAFKVEAINNTNPPPAGYISESNWLYVLVEEFKQPDEKLPELIAPNVFTPDDNGENDRFYISGLNGGREYDDIQLTVYNRWGQLVYEDANFDKRNNPQQGWDGTSVFTGERLSDGVYYYVVSFNDQLTNTSKDLQGSVTILGSN